LVFSLGSRVTVPALHDTRRTGRCKHLTLPNTRCWSSRGRDAELERLRAGYRRILELSDDERPAAEIAEAAVALPEQLATLSDADLSELTALLVEKLQRRATPATGGEKRSDLHRAIERALSQLEKPSAR
jgi:hypothetical protein